MKSYLILIIIIFGFIISCDKDFGPLEFPLNLSVIFTKTEYQENESVQFLIKNNSEQTIRFLANTCRGLIGYKIERKLDNLWTLHSTYHLTYNTDSSGIVVVCDMEPLNLKPNDKYSANEYFKLQHGEYRLILQYYFGEYYKPEQEMRLFYTKAFVIN